WNGRRPWEICTLCLIRWRPLPACLPRLATNATVPSSHKAGRGNWLRGSIEGGGEQGRGPRSEWGGRAIGSSEPSLPPRANDRIALLLQEARGQDLERLRRDGFEGDVHKPNRLAVGAGDFLPRHQYVWVCHEILVLNVRAIRGLILCLEVGPFPRRTEQGART